MTPPAPSSVIPLRDLPLDRRQVNAENWHEERDRLVQLLEAIESGAVTHIDEDGLRQLQAATPQNVAMLKVRLAKLNARLGNDKG